MAIITTVTLNPALDEAVSLAAFALGSTNRSALDALDPGGKGVNASRVIARMGRETIALGFVGGVTGNMLREKLDAEGLLHAFDEVEELTRLNVMIYERSSGRRTRLYLPGPHVPVERIAGLRTRLAQAPPGSYVVFGGSVPPGLPHEIYRDLVQWLSQRGVHCIVDTSGIPLALVLSAHPALIKPNVEEACEVLGRELKTDDEILEAANELRRRGALRVVISQGADGAIGTGPDGCWKAIPPKVQACSTVGSGDSMVAGIAIALSEGGELKEGLMLGTAAGAATATIAGTKLAGRGDVEALLAGVQISPLVQVVAAAHRQDVAVGLGLVLHDHG